MFAFARSLCWIVLRQAKALVLQNAFSSVEMRMLPEMLLEMVQMCRKWSYVSEWHVNLFDGAGEMALIRGSGYVHLRLG